MAAYHRQFTAVLACVAALLCAAPSAFATDSIYWTNYGGNTISFAGLDGSGGGNLNTTGTTIDGPEGVAFDLPGGRFYWADYNPATTKISFANLDGAGAGGNLNTAGAVPAEEPAGIAIDVLSGRVFWAVNDAISFARLDGSGGGNLNTTGATTSCAVGVVVDPAAGRVYWSNCSGGKISFARLDGSGGADLNTAGATTINPQGVALDLGSDRIYWSNNSGNKISFARLDGSGGGDLNTTGATVSSPTGVTIDPDTRRIYWANGGAGISFANLDGGGGGNLSTTGASLATPNYPALLKTPIGTGAPVITGGATPGSALRCSDGSWAADSIASLLYRMPQSFSYQWSKGGTDIGGATGSSFTPTSAGDYRCAVTARNPAGSATQTSALFGRTALSGFDFSPNVISVARGSTPLTAASKGGRFSFKLTAAAQVKIAIARKLSGRKKGERCVKPKRKLKRKCTRFQLRGTLTRNGQTGNNTVLFSGRIGSKPLPRGRYRATITATNAAGTTASQTTSFRVVRTKSKKRR